MSASCPASPKASSGPDGNAAASATAARRRLVLALGAALALSACGKKGELELPPPEATPSPDAVPSQERPADDGPAGAGQGVVR